MFNFALQDFVLPEVNCGRADSKQGCTAVYFCRSLWGDGVVTLGRRSGHFGETEWSLWGDEFDKSSSLSAEK
jgi:hypothetical protein